MALAVLSVGGCCTIMARPPFPEVRENYQYTQRYIIDIHNLRRCTLWRKIKSLRKNGKIRQNGGWIAFLASWVKQGAPWKKIMLLLHQPKGQTIFLSNRQDHASFRNHHWSENRMSQQIALYICIYMYIYMYLYIYIYIHVASRRQPPAPHRWAHTAGAWFRGGAESGAEELRRVKKKREEFDSHV